MTAAGRRGELPLPDGIDTALVVLYLVGIYLGVDIKLSAGTPVPTVISGFAGGLLLLKHMQRLREDQVICLLLVVALYLGSILAAGDAGMVGKRTTGLIQIAYSFIIGYGFYLTVLLFDRASIERIFGVFCVAIIVGCTLENYVDPFRQLSDAVRGAIYHFGIYRADERDLLLYGQIRPKLFTSEPSMVSFAFVLYAFCWYVLSQWRWKLLAYAAMLAAGFFLMRGPTLLLGFVLLGPYELFLAPRRQRADGTVEYDIGRGALAVSLALVLAAAAVAVAFSLYGERIEAIRNGTDPSFFARVIAPYLVTAEVVHSRPIAGIGLTAERMIGDLINQIYMQSDALVSNYTFSSAKHALTNYFWTHWIYLGLAWGLIVLTGLTGYLRILGAPSILFCWSVWTVMGQASGAYVSPKTWTVFYLACLVAILQQRAEPAAAPVRQTKVRQAPVPPALPAGWRT